MKEITLNRTTELISMGIYPKCKVSRGVLRPIRSLLELNNYRSLCSMQDFTLFGYDDDALRIFKIPDDALSVNLDEATDMLLAGFQICARRIEDDEVVFTSIRELLEFYKACQNSGDSFLLYWRDE